MRPVTLFKCLFSSMLFASVCGNSAAEGINTEVSGFARVVVGELGDPDVSFFGYDDTVTFEQDSLLGVQGQIQFNDQFSATALGLARDNEAGSGVEWLYIGYRPTNALNIKLGQMQTPFYSLSDSLDVGYSYPWVSAPKEVYNDFVFRTFQGVDARYGFVFDNLTAHLEVYYGSFDDEVTVGSTTIETEVSDLRGLIADVRIANFKLRASYHSGFVELFLPESDQLADILAASGFNQSAASLNPDGDTVFHQVGIEYDSLTYFLKAEWIDIDFSSNYLQDVRAHYLTYGRYFGQFTTLITYSQRNDDAVNPVDEIPSGISPEVDQLSSLYQSLFETLIDGQIDSWTLSLRWDFRRNMALKGEYKQMESKNTFSAAFQVDEGATFDKRSHLTSIALEWVF